MSKKKLDNSKPTLQEQLMAADHEKLVDILVSLHTNNKDIQKQLDIIFAGLDEDPKKITSMIKKEIVLLKKPTKFLDYHELGPLADRLDRLRLIIINDLHAKSPKIAFEVMLAFLDLHENILDRVNDRHDTISTVFIVACKELGKIAHTIADVNLIEIVETVFSRFMNSSYIIYENIIQNFQSALSTEGFDALQTKFHQTVTTENLFKVKRGLQTIADCKNDVDAFIDACSLMEKPGTHDRLDIAKRLIMHRRVKGALEWLDSIDLQEGHYWQHNLLKELKIQALELDGEYEQAHHERLSWFTENLNPTLYKDILKTTKPDFKEKFKSDSINNAFQFPEPHTALRFLIAIQEFDEAAQCVRLRFNELSGKEYYTLRPIANVLQAIDPLAATLLYRKMIEPILEETKCPYYSRAAKDLVTCGLLNTKVTDWQEWQKHDDYFKEIELQYKRKTGFWSEYTSVLHKQAARVSAQ
jgi:hypothetical protein